MKLAKRMTLSMPVQPDATLLVEIEDRRVEEGRFLRYEAGVVVVMVEGDEIGFDTRNLAGSKEVQS